MDPGEGGDTVGFVLAVAKTAGVVLLVFEAVGIGVVRDLEVVLAKLRDETELILRGAVIDEGCETAIAVSGVVQDLADRWRKAVVATVAVETGVVGELL